MSRPALRQMPPPPSRVWNDPALGFDLLETFVYIILARALPANFYQVLAIVDSFAAGAVLVMLTLAVLAERQAHPHKSE